MKPTVTVEDVPVVSAMEREGYVCVGFVATRNPDGSFNPSVPIFRDPEWDDVEDELEDLTRDQLISLFDEMIREREKVRETLEVGDDNK